MSLYVRHLLFSLLCPWFMKPHPMSWGGWQISADGRTSEKWAAEVGGQSLRPPLSLCSSGGLALLHLVTPRHTLSHLVTLCHALAYLATPCHAFSYLVTPCHTSLHLFTPFQSCHTLSKHLSHPWTVNCAMMTEPTHKLANQNKTSVSQIQKQLKMSLNSHFWFAWPKKINSC